jgi:hypothetical protein
MELLIIPPVTPVLSYPSATALAAPAFKYDLLYILQSSISFTSQVLPTFWKHPSTHPSPQPSNPQAEFVQATVFLFDLKNRA